MDEKIKAAVLASLVGDALSLGVHWEYNPEHILKTHGRVNTFLAPKPGSYHGGKSAGDFTHMGDQTMVLLESVVQSGGFDLQDFARRWRDMFKSYSGYVDQATRKTLQNFDGGASPQTSGADSNELAGAVRMAPLFCALHDKPELLLQAAHEQTAMTHNNPAALAAAKFLALTVMHVLDGSDPLAAMRQAGTQDYGPTPVAQWVDAGLNSVDKKTVTAITRFGQSCHTPNALPGVVHLVAKYPDDLPTCLVECVMAGGDSAARAMAAGLILGAYLGKECIPDIWLAGLRAKERIRSHLAALDSS